MFVKCLYCLGLHPKCGEASSRTCSSGLKKPNIPTTIDTLLQMHTLTPLPFPPFLITPTAPNAPSPSPAIVRIDAFQRRDPCALALCWRAAFDCCDEGGGDDSACFHSTLIYAVCHRRVNQDFNANPVSPVSGAAASSAFFAPRGGDGGR